MVDFLRDKGKILEEIPLKNPGLAIDNLTRESDRRVYLSMELQPVVGSVRPTNLKALIQEEDLKEDLMMEDMMSKSMSSLTGKSSENLF